MKRYLLFAYFDYYPSGGSQEVRGDFDTLEEVRAWIGSDAGGASFRYDNYEVLDLEKREWVQEEF